MRLKRLLCAALLLALAVAAVGCGGAKALDKPAMTTDDWIQSEDKEAAVAWFQEKLAVNPSDAGAHYGLGRVAVSQERFDDAITHFEKTVELQPESANYHYWLAIAYVNKLQNTQDFMEMGQIAPKVKSNIEKSVELDPENIDARMFLAQFLLNAPPIAGGDAERGKAELQEIIARDPRRGNILQGELFVRDKKYDDALAAFNTALAEDPDDPDVHYRIGRACQDAEYYDRAFEAFEHALQADPGHMNAMYQLGRTAVFAETTYERGIECLMKFMETEPGAGMPTWANAQWRLGMIYEQMGSKDKAIAAYKKAIELNPEYEEAKKSLQALESN